MILLELCCCHCCCCQVCCYVYLKKVVFFLFSVCVRARAHVCVTVINVYSVRKRRVRGEKNGQKKNVIKI